MAKRAKAEAVKKRAKKASRMKIKFRYIAGEQWRFDWVEADVREFIVAYIELREIGIRDHDMIADLSKLFKRKPVEVAILIMDLGDKGYIGPEGKGTKPQRFTIADNEDLQEG